MVGAGSVGFSAAITAAGRLIGAHIIAPKGGVRAEPDFTIETAHISAGQAPVAGVDEAGRGPLAGPVVAAAVVLPAKAFPPGINDSKKLTPSRRQALFEQLHECADIGVGIVGVEHIDRENILNATLAAMRHAVEKLAAPPAMVLVDGNRLPELSCAARAIVGGDGLSLSIAAASIIAKVTRDAIMDELAAQFPAYGWQRNRGYGTAEHLAALKTHGPCIHHRRSFRPVREAL